MVEEADIWQSAALFIKQHGEDAAVFAAMEAAALEAGDLEGKATWLRVIAAIQELQQISPPLGGITH